MMHRERAHVDQLPSAPQPKQAVMAERDGLFTFIGKMKIEVYAST